MSCSQLLREKQKQKVQNGKRWETWAKNANKRPLDQIKFTLMRDQTVLRVSTVKIPAIIQLCIVETKQNFMNLTAITRLLFPVELSNWYSKFSRNYFLRCKFMKIFESLFLILSFIFPAACCVVYYFTLLHFNWNIYNVFYYIFLLVSCISLKCCMSTLCRSICSPRAV